MRSDKKTPLKSDKKAAPKIQKKGTIGYNKKSALLEDAITQMNAGKYGRASSALKDLLALDPLNAEARRLFATLHLRLGSLMSARTAFESLAREAMERQDYWLAESLLREYLAAGPRCVPFLERLGHVYEEKGDVMAAVAEYGKAVEVLLEDPDREHPNRASELFGRIRSIAPGSPVAFRFAAMFDTVTGHVLQATPQPPVGDSGSELPQPTPVPESLADNSTLVPMPWEQMESPPPEGALSPEVEVPSVGDSIETMASVAPLASVQSATETLGQVNAPDRSPATEVANSPTALELQLHHESSSLSVASSTESIQVTGQNAPPVDDSALPTPTVAEDSQAAIEVLAQASSHPIKEEPKGPTPMPWDQIEDAAPAISPEADRQAPIASEVAPPLSVEADLPVPPVAEILQSTIEASAEGTRHPIAGSMTTLASMPWDQVDDVASATSPVTASDRSMGAEVVFALSEDAELPLAPVVEAASPTIEVLRNVSAHPIAEAPISPASMPWDQIEEKAEASSPTADLKMDAEVMEAESAKELTATDLLLNGGTTAEPLIPPDVPFTSSSGLSWEDILAAVTAMQAVPGPVQSVPRTESEASTNSAVPEETATTVTPPIDPSETEWLSLVPPVSNSFTGLVSDSPPLSAPMPWEQIEVEDLAIPRQDPEPEFGSVSTDVMGGPQDSTVVMPVAMEMHESVSATGVFAEETVVDSLGHLESPSTPEFRILSPDAPVEPREQPISIHIPVKMVGSVEEPALAAVSESKPPVESTIALSIDLPLRLAGSEATPEPESDEPRAVPAESLTEAVVTASPGMPPLIVKPAAVQDIQVPLAASTKVFPAEPISLVDQPIAQVAGQEPTIPMTQETVVDAAGPSAIPSFIAHQPLVQADLTALVSETVGVEEDVAPMSESETSPLLAQGHASMPAGIVSNAGTSQLRESVVPDEEVPNESALPVSDAIQAQSTDTPVVVPSDEPSLTSIESMRAAEAVRAAAAAAPDASAVGGLRILWDDSSSKPIPSASTGNMLTRWLSKPKEVAPSEASHSTTISVEPMSPVAPPAGERQEATPLVTAPPVDRSDDSTPPPVEQHAPRPKPSKSTAGQAWRHIGRAATSLIGAGVSTTRSLVVLVVALIGLALLLVAGAVGAIALTWLVLEEQPTPTYRNMTSVPQHTLQDSQKNGYFLLLGLGATPTQDPVQAGMDRRVEEADRAVTHTCLTGEGNGLGIQEGASAEVTGKWLKTVDPAAQMRMEATGVKSWASQAGVAMGRYRQWLTKPFEDWGFGQPVSPNCGVILYAHRLYVAEGFAQDVETGVARLESDLTAWRTVLGQAKTMPVKMLASDALNDDIAVVSGLLLRPDLDDRLISRLAKLVRPLDQAEQSVRWPMQSQFVLATKTLEEAVNHDPADARPFYGSVAAALPLPKQRRFNAYAQYYEAVGKAAAEGRYADLPKQSQFVRTPPYGLSDVLVNPIESLVGIDPLPTWETYAGRVLETDARLRLASLQAWLRRTPPEQDLLTRVAKAGQGLYDPFTGFPMLVNMKKGVFYSVGRDIRDNEAQDRFDVVAQIPPTAWAGGKRTADLNRSK